MWTISASVPPRIPGGPSTGRAHVVKGGSWDSRPSALSASAWNFGYIGYREGDYGFGCAADVVETPVETSRPDSR